MTKVVLITAIGGDTSQGVATILRESRPNLRLIGIDVHERHAGRLFVDAFETVPSGGDPEYRKALQTVIKKHKIDIAIPMSEPELEALYPFTDTISDVTFVTAGARVVAAGLDKLATAIELEKLGLPIPWTISSGIDGPLAYPCILKARHGSGSRAVFRIETAEDVDYLLKRHGNSVFQELLEPEDREITCAVYRRNDGEVCTLQMLRRLAGGFTGWARSIVNKEISEMCSRIAVGLDLRGSMNVQLRLTNNGPRVFEINPRFSSTVLMRHRIGFSDVLWALDEAEGNTIHFPVIPEGKVMVRTQGAEIIDET